MSYTQGVYHFEATGKTRVDHSELKIRNDLYEKNGKGYSRVSGMAEVNSIPDYAEYEDEVAVTLKVDDKPFNSSVRDCCRQMNQLRQEIDELTATTAQCAGLVTAAKSAAALKIAGALNRGFSQYIHYTIQEKMVELEAKIPSLASTLEALGNNLSERRQQLEQDYVRITSRYSKIITTLNEELANRIFQLDKPAFELCRQLSHEIFADPIGEAFGQSVCSGNEQLQSAGGVSISLVKDNTAQALGQLNRYMRQLKLLNAGIDSILRDNDLEEKQRFAMPVLRLEASALSDAPMQSQIVVPPIFAERDQEELDQLLESSFAAQTSTGKSAAELEYIDRSMQRQITQFAAEHSNTDPRVMEQVKLLWEHNKENLHN